MRRRFTRSISSNMQKLNTSISDSTPNARNPKRTVNLDKNQSPSRHISEMLLSSQKWLETMSLFTMAKVSTTSKSNSIWLDATSENSQSPTNPPATVKLVWEPPRDQLTHLSSDCTYYFDGSYSQYQLRHLHMSWFYIYNHEKVAKVHSIYPEN